MTRLEMVTEQLQKNENELEIKTKALVGVLSSLQTSLINEEYHLLKTDEYLRSSLYDDIKHLVREIKETKELLIEGLDDPNELIPQPGELDPRMVFMKDIDDSLM